MSRVRQVLLAVTKSSGSTSVERHLVRVEYEVWGLREGKRRHCARFSAMRSDRLASATSPADQCQRDAALGRGCDVVDRRPH